MCPVSHIDSLFACLVDYPSFCTLQILSSHNPAAEESLHILQYILFFGANFVGILPRSQHFRRYNVHLRLAARVFCPKKDNLLSSSLFDSHSAPHMSCNVSLPSASSSYQVFFAICTHLRSTEFQPLHHSDSSHKSLVPIILWIGVICDHTKNIICGPLFYRRHSNMCHLVRLTVAATNFTGMFCSLFLQKLYTWRPG